MKNIFAIIFVLLIVFFGATTLVAEDNSEKTIDDIAKYFEENDFDTYRGRESYYEYSLSHNRYDGGSDGAYYTGGLALNMGSFNSVIIEIPCYKLGTNNYGLNFAIIYKYDTSEPGERYILEEIKKTGVIWLKGSQVPAIVNCSFVLTMYHFSPDKDKIKELFMKF